MDRFGNSCPTVTSWRGSRVLDLSWLREEVDGLYCADNGRPGIDPEVAVRLMLASLLLGIIHDPLAAALVAVFIASFCNSP